MSNRTYFKHIVHMRDDEGVLCAGIMGNTMNVAADKVNCRKCKIFIESPDKLPITRENRAQHAKYLKKLRRERKHGDTQGEHEESA